MPGTLMLCSQQRRCAAPLPVKEGARGAGEEGGGRGCGAAEGQVRVFPELLSSMPCHTLPTPVSGYESSWTCSQLLCSQAARFQYAHLCGSGAARPYMLGLSTVNIGAPSDKGCAKHTRPVMLLLRPQCCTTLGSCGHCSLPADIQSACAPSLPNLCPQASNGFCAAGRTA